MIAVKHDKYHITITVIAPAHPFGDAVGSRVQGFYSNIEVYIIKGYLEFGLLGGRPVSVRLKLSEIIGPRSLHPGRVVKISIYYRGLVDSVSSIDLLGKVFCLGSQNRY